MVRLTSSIRTIQHLSLRPCTTFARHIRAIRSRRPLTSQRRPPPALRRLEHLKGSQRGTSRQRSMSRKQRPPRQPASARPRGWSGPPRAGPGGRGAGPVPRSGRPVLPSAAQAGCPVGAKHAQHQHVFPAQGDLLEFVTGL